MRLTATLREEPAAPSPAGTRAAPAVAADRAATRPDPYFTAREVDTPAVARERPPLIYPENPFLWKLRGTVRLRVFINEHGTVDRAQVLYAHPPGEFEEAALEAAGRLVYDAAIKNGRPVKSQKVIEVSFNPDAEADRPPPR